MGSAPQEVAGGRTVGKAKGMSRSSTASGVGGQQCLEVEMLCKGKATLKILGREERDEEEPTGRRARRMESGSWRCCGWCWLPARTCNGGATWWGAGGGR